MRVLITGFEPFGGHRENPSSALAQGLDGERIAGADVVGRVLPVTMDGLLQRTEQLLEEADPAVVISLGLAAGTPTLRLERVAVNLADFEIADNSGLLLRDAAVVDAAPSALFATLPLAAIEQRLLADGVPVQMSNSAGAYLCNAAMYCFLHAARPALPCGFIHLPYLPRQVAEIIDAGKAAAGLELQQRADLASMPLDVMLKAVHGSIEATLQTL